eukprot:s4275_g6.t1
MCLRMSFYRFPRIRLIRRYRGARGAAHAKRAKRSGHMTDPPPAAFPSLRHKQVRQLQKTEMCKFHMMNRCGKGPNCSFAHDVKEIRDKPNLNRTSMCKTFLLSGNCDKPRCAFAHDERELRTTEGFFKTKLCRFANRGRCKHGAACRFAHSTQELLPEEKPAAGPQTQDMPPVPFGMTLQQEHTVPTRPDVPGAPDRGSRSQMRARIVDDARQKAPSETNTSGSDSMSEQPTTRDEASDQSTRADTSASVPTPEGSGDSGPEERPRQRRGGERPQARHCTTMMLTNVPPFLTQGALISLLEDLSTYMRGAFDFFYCPWDPYQDRNLGYAIVNFFMRSVAAEFEKQWANQPLLPGTHGSKRLRIMPAALQGRAANLRHFSGFSLAHHVDPRFRPLVRAGPKESLQPMALSEEIRDTENQNKQGAAGRERERATSLPCPPVACQPFGTEVAALGSPLTFAEPVAAITAAMNHRARKAFAKHSKLLCAPTPIKARIRMHTTLVRNAALWASQAWPITETLSKAVNSTHLRHIRAMMGDKRHPGETWVDWNSRSLRRARVQLFQSGEPRWSTFVLGQTWGLYGHMARSSQGGGGDAPVEEPQVVEAAAEHPTLLGGSAPRAQIQPRRGPRATASSRGRARLDASSTGQSGMGGNDGDFRRNIRRAVGLRQAKQSQQHSTYQGGERSTSRPMKPRLTARGEHHSLPVAP